MQTEKHNFLLAEEIRNLAAVLSNSCQPHPELSFFWSLIDVIVCLKLFCSAQQSQQTEAADTDGENTDEKIRRLTHDARYYKYIHHHNFILPKDPFLRISFHLHLFLRSVPPGSFITILLFAALLSFFFSNSLNVVLCDAVEVNASILTVTRAHLDQAPKAAAGTQTRGRAEGERGTRSPADASATLTHGEGSSGCPESIFPYHNPLLFFLQCPGKQSA